MFEFKSIDRSLSNYMNSKTHFEFNSNNLTQTWVMNIDQVQN